MSINSISFQFSEETVSANIKRNYVNTCTLNKAKRNDQKNARSSASN